MENIMVMWSIIFVIALVPHSIRTQSGTPCKTPNGDTAVCISVYKCPIILNAVKSAKNNQRKFLQASQCGYENDEYLVCCGTEDNYRSPTTSLSNPNIPDRNSCGVQEPNRILNGDDTEMDEFPWMALLQYKNSSGFKLFGCGGTLISSRYVLTAAHCVQLQRNSLLGKLDTVRLGEWDTDTPVDCISVGQRRVCNAESVDIEVEDAVVHNEYNKNRKKENDIALIRLKRPVSFSNYIRPICLPLRNESSNIGDYLYVAGWGATEKSVSSSIKQKLKVPVADKIDCSARFARVSTTVGKTHICAGGEAGKDSCRGDSGGPLMRTSPSGLTRWYIEGIVSIGRNRCGSAGWPGVYTMVRPYLDWIYSNVKA